MDGDIKDDSIYSLGCKLCQRFSSETFSDKSGNKTKFLNFITSSEKEWKEKILLHRYLFDFILALKIALPSVSFLLQKPTRNAASMSSFIGPIGNQVNRTIF